MKREKLEKLLDRFDNLYNDNNKRIYNLRDTLWMLDSLDEDVTESHESIIDQFEKNGDVFGLKSLCRNMLIALRTIICEATVVREIIISELKDELQQQAEKKMNESVDLSQDIVKYVNKITNVEDEGDGSN